MSNLFLRDPQPAPHGRVFVSRGTGVFDRDSVGIASDIHGIAAFCDGFFGERLHPSSLILHPLREVKP